MSIDRAMLLWLLVLIPSPCSASEDLPDTFVACLTHPPHSISRVIRGSAGGVDFALVQDRDKQPSLCIGSSACTWKLSDIPQAFYSPLEAEVEARCTGAEWLHESYANTCTSTTVKGTSVVLGVMVRAIFGDHHICNGLQLLDGAFLSDVGYQALTLPIVDGNRSCLIFTVDFKHSRVGVWLTPQCPQTAAELSALALIDAHSKIPGSIAVGAIVRDASFFVPLMLKSDGTIDVAGSPVVMGLLEHKYTSAWLEAVVTLVQIDTERGKPTYDPLESARSDHFVGRMARWLLAGARQVEYAPFDDLAPAEAVHLRKESLRWMAGVVLESDQSIEQTLLRGELARRDWSKYD